MLIKRSYYLFNSSENCIGLLATIPMDATTRKSNPLKERKVKGRVEIAIQKCKGCELCTVTCKEQALSLSEAINGKGYRYVIANNDLCTGCVNCALICPDAVITVYRTHPTKKPVDITTPAIKEEIRAMITQGGNVGLQVLPKI